MSSQSLLDRLPGVIADANSELDKISATMLEMETELASLYSKKRTTRADILGIEFLETQLEKLEERRSKLDITLAKSSSKYEDLTKSMKKYSDQLLEELELTSALYDDPAVRADEVQFRKIRNKLAEEGLDTERGVVAAYLEGVRFFQEQVRLATEARKVRKETKDGEKATLDILRQFEASTQRDLDLMGLTNMEREKAVMLDRVLVQVGEQKGKLSDQDLTYLRSRIALVAEQAEKEKILSEYSGQRALAQRAETQMLLNQLVRDGLLTQEEAERAAIEMFDQTIDKSEELKRALQANLVIAGFQAVEDSLVSLVTTGKGNFKEFANALLEQMLRLILRLKVLLPMMQALFPEGGFEVSNTGNITASTDGPTRQNGGSWRVGDGMSRYGGFSNGGSFNVGGNGGTDSQLVAFRASPNEQVTVTRPEQSLGGQAQVNVVVHNNATGTEARVERDGNGDLQVLIETVENNLAGRVARGGGTLNNSFERRYGLNPAAGI